MRHVIWFCLHLTIDEHDIVERQIREFCSNNNLIVNYYTHRECKISGNKLGPLLKWLKKTKIDDSIIYYAK